MILTALSLDLSQVMNLLAFPVAVENVVDFDVKPILFLRFANITTLFHMCQVFVELESKIVYLLLGCFRLDSIPLKLPLNLNCIDLLLRLYFFVHGACSEHFSLLFMILTILHIRR